MSTNPDFYLTDFESREVFEVRACYAGRRLTIGNKDDYLLVEVSPSIPQPWQKDIDKVLMTVRFAGSTLFPINEWPMHVYVCKMLNEEVINTGKASANDIEIIMWGTLFKSFDEAKHETEIYAKQIEKNR